uniref:1,5-anhydro-D-fructose reductase-like n=1 Tax=Diabrotica virgifera virgifera TaxID=50390 RepID=A0A6P7FD77_DIAVI
MRGIHRDRVEKYLTESLKKLGLEYVDLYLIHFPVGIAETEGSIVYEKEDHLGIWKVSSSYIDYTLLYNFREKTLVKVLDNPVILDIAKKHNKKSAQVALRFLLQQNIVVIPKSVNPERLKSNFDIFNFYLDDKDMTRLRELEVGEDARMGDWKILPGLAEQPAYPFRRY